MGFFNSKKQPVTADKFPAPLPQHRWLVSYVFKGSRGADYGNFQYNRPSESPLEPPLTQQLLDRMDNTAKDWVEKHVGEPVNVNAIITLNIVYLGYTTDKEHLG